LRTKRGVGAILLLYGMILACVTIVY